MTKLGGLSKLFDKLSRMQDERHTSWENTLYSAGGWAEFIKIIPVFENLYYDRDVCLSVSVCVDIYLRVGQKDLRQTFRGSSVSAAECFRQKKSLKILTKKSWIFCFNSSGVLKPLQLCEK